MLCGPSRMPSSRSVPLVETLLASKSNWRAAAQSFGSRTNSAEASSLPHRRQIPELDVPGSMFNDPETLPDWMKRRETWKAEDRG